MLQVNIFTKEKHSQTKKKQTYGYQRGKGLEKGLIERLG